MAAGLHYFTGQVRGEGCFSEPSLITDGNEELLHVQPSVSFVLGDLGSGSSGTLYITSKRVIWLSDVDKSKGYSLDFLSISLHAVCRDSEAYSSPCIYLQIETEDGTDEEDLEESGLDNVSYTDISKIKEIRLVPSDPSQLDTLFSIFCEGAELNPEPQHETQEFEEENEWFFGPDQNDVMEADDDEDLESHNPSNPIGHAVGAHDIVRDVLQLQIEDQRFADAEETELQSM